MCSSDLQALGHPRPLGDGVGGGLLEGVVPELQHGAVPDQVLPLRGQVEEFRIHGSLPSPLPYRR